MHAAPGGQRGGSTVTVMGATLAAQSLHAGGGETGGGAGAEVSSGSQPGITTTKNEATNTERRRGDMLHLRRLREARARSERRLPARLMEDTRDATVTKNDSKV